MADSDALEIYCRACGVPLLPGPARAIGVCTECVYKSTISVSRIPSPGYASSQDTPNATSPGYSKREEEEVPPLS